MGDIFENIKELAKFEIVYTDSENRQHTAKSYIKSIYEGRLLIAPPEQDGKAVNIPDNQDIMMIIYADDAVYCGESKVLEKEISSTPGVWISYPYNSQDYQRREYLRAPLHYRVILTLIRNRSRSEIETSEVLTRDISGKGFSFISDNPIGEYYDIEAEIIIDNDQPSIKSRCEHIYTNPSNGKYISAFAFVDITPRDSERIIRECFKQQLAPKE